MKLFRRKNKRTIEEQNRHNEKIWKKEISDEPEEKLTNPDFTKREFNLNNESEKVIQVVYEEGQEVDVKLFLSSNEWSTFSRNYKEKVNDNFIRLLIDISKRTDASLLSGGNYNFNDDFEKGYSLLFYLDMLTKIYFLWYLKFFETTD